MMIMMMTVSGRGQLLYTRHPFNARLKHLLPQTDAVKDCRGFDVRLQCFLAGWLWLHTAADLIR